jgi:pyroglutamyl-peptidase
VVPDGPAAYWSTLPIKAMAAAVQAQGVVAEVSQTAGTFVCNHVFYALMHALATTDAANDLSGTLPARRGGFVHVPDLAVTTHQADAPTSTMALTDMVRALRAALVCALETTTDRRLSGGAVS